MCRLSINLKDSGLRKSLIYDIKKEKKENCPITNSIKLFNAFWDSIPMKASLALLNIKCLHGFMIKLNLE